MESLIELIVSLGISVVVMLLAVGGYIWMLKNHEKRVTSAEDRLIEMDKRMNNHDVIFEVIKLDLEYMKKGIDELRSGIDRLEHQHDEEFKELRNLNK